MYSTRDAPQIWQDEVIKSMVELGFTPIVLHPSAFFRKERDLKEIAHVDDFLCVGEELQLDWLYLQLHRKYDFKASPKRHISQQTHPLDQLWHRDRGRSEALQHSS